MRVNDDYTSWNAAQQVTDSNSVYNYWSSLLKLRKEFKDIFIYGNFKMLASTHESVFAYQRSLGGSGAVIILNFSEQEVSWQVGDEGVGLKNAEMVIGNYGTPKIKEGAISLRAFECAVFLV